MKGKANMPYTYMYLVDKYYILHIAFFISSKVKELSYLNIVQPTRKLIQWLVKNEWKFTIYWCMLLKLHGIALKLE